MGDRGPDGADTADVEDRLRATMRAHADRLDIPEEPFDARREPLTVLFGDLDPGGSPRADADDRHVDRNEPFGLRARAGGRRSRGTRRARVLRAAAAAAAVVVLVAGLAVRDGGDEGTDLAVGPAGTDPGRPPSGTHLVPAWVPEGWELLELRAKRDAELADELEVVTGGPPAQIRQIQLVERAERDTPARILLEVNHSGPLGAQDGPVGTVRGRPVSASSGGGDVRLSWDENGTRIVATVRELALDEALRVLDGLGRRPDEFPQAGFTSLATSGWRLRTETQPPASVVKTHAVYAPAGTSPDGVGVQVYAEPGRGPDTNLYSEARGTRLADGIVRLLDTVVDVPELTLLWRDGTRVRVIGERDPEVAERIARSVTAVPVGDVDRLAGEAAARLAAKPPIAAITTSVGRVELKPRIGSLRTFCVHAAAATACGSSDVQDAADVFVGPARYVVAAQRDATVPPQFRLEGVGDARWPYRIEAGRGDGWWLSFSPAPPEVVPVRPYVPGTNANPFTWPLPGRR